MGLQDAIFDCDIGFDSALQADAAGRGNVAVYPGGEGHIPDGKDLVAHGIVVIVQQMDGADIPIFVEVDADLSPRRRKWKSA